MSSDEIQKMFAEMGLGTLEEREKLIKELSINMVDSSYENSFEIKTCNNTLKEKQYA